MKKISKNQKNMYILYNKPAGRSFLQPCRLDYGGSNKAEGRTLHTAACLSKKRHRLFYSPDTCVPSAFMWYLSL